MESDRGMGNPALMPPKKASLTPESIRRTLDEGASRKESIELVHHRLSSMDQNGSARKVSVAGSGLNHSTSSEFRVGEPGQITTIGNEDGEEGAASQGADEGWLNDGLTEEPSSPPAELGDTELQLLSGQ